MKVVTELPLTEECHHYEDISEVPWDIQKYWHQRYSIFSAYNDGIQLTDDVWFGVTPEPVATQIAKDMAKTIPASKTVLIDLFAGAGGNVIAFALSERWSSIVAVECDAATLACAQNNAAVYGVADRITWVHGDSFDLLRRLRDERTGEGEAEAEEEDLLFSSLPGSLREKLRRPEETTAIFASPPWGGVGYRFHDVFDLATMEPYNLRRLHDACRPMWHALYLPRTSDLQQIARLVPDDQKLDVVQYCMEGASKALVAYIPASNAAS